MEDKLVKFYYDCLLPELTDPVHNKEGCKIRDPQYMIDAHEKFKAEKADNERDLKMQQAPALKKTAAPAPKKAAAPAPKKRAVPVKKKPSSSSPKKNSGASSQKTS